MNLDDVAPCGQCGGTMRELHHPAEAGFRYQFPESWSYQCRDCGYEYGNNGECTERLTMRTAPWTQALAAEVEYLLIERISKEDHAVMGVANVSCEQLGIGVRSLDYERLLCDNFGDTAALHRGAEWARAMALRDPEWCWVAGWLQGTARVTESVRCWYGDPYCTRHEDND